MNSVRLWTDRAHEQRDQVQAAMQTIHQLQQMIQTIQTELDGCLSHHSTILARTQQQLTESQQEVEELKIRLRGGEEYSALDPHTRH
jgi:hypothetical protein